MRSKLHYSLLEAMLCIKIEKQKKNKNHTFYVDFFCMLVAIFVEKCVTFCLYS